MGEALGPLIGAGKEAEVYAFGAGRVAKIYRAGRPKRTAFREAFITSAIESFGLPSPRIWGVEAVGGRWAVIMDRVDGPTFAQTIERDPARAPSLVKAMVQLQLRIHGTAGAQLPRLNERLARNIGLADLDPPTRARLLNRLAAMPSGDTLCHGDFHPLNIIGDEESAIIVDWLDALLGAPAADACRSYVLIRSFSPALAHAYLDAYTRAGDLGREAILAWMPIVAAARLAEGIEGAEAQALREMVERHNRD